MASSPQISPTDPPRTQFEPTRWSLVRRARVEDSQHRRLAIEDLCRAYWFPLYAFLRRSGRSVEDAQDLVQEFFLQLLDGRLLGVANPERGKFRTLLLVSLQNLDVNTFRAATAQKRGGGLERFALDDALAEERWQGEMSQAGTPDAVFDRVWAETVMDRASADLRAAHEATGKVALFDELFPRLNGHPANPLAMSAARLGMTEAAVKMALSRLRRAFADALRAEIADTVATQDEVQEELRYLLSALA